MIEPTCRFCKRKMLLCNTKGGYDDPQEFHYRCNACESSQAYDTKAHCFYWNFDMGPYRVCCWAQPNNPQCTIFLIDNGGIDKALVVMPFIPYLTPTNTNEERIKLLILFS